MAGDPRWNELLEELELSEDAPLDEVQARFSEELSRREEGTQHPVKPVRQRFKDSLARLQGYAEVLTARANNELFGTRLQEIEALIGKNQHVRAKVLLEDLTAKAEAAQADEILLQIRGLQAEIEARATPAAPAETPSEPAPQPEAKKKKKEPPTSAPDQPAAPSAQGKPPRKRGLFGLFGKKSEDSKAVTQPPLPPAETPSSPVEEPPPPAKGSPPPPAEESPEPAEEPPPVTMIPDSLRRTATPDETDGTRADLITIRRADGELIHLCGRGHLSAGRTPDNDLLLFCVVPGDAKQTASLTRAVSRRQFEIFLEAGQLVIRDGTEDPATGEVRTSAMGTSLNRQIAAEHILSPGDTGLLGVSDNPARLGLPHWQIEWLPEADHPETLAGVAFWRQDKGDHAILLWGRVSLDRLRIDGNAILFRDGDGLLCLELDGVSTPVETNQAIGDAEVIALGKTACSRIEDFFEA